MSVTVIGDSFVDIIVPISGVNRGETHHRNVAVSCGGTANVAAQVARLGEEAKFVGKLGNDALGSYFWKNLKDSGVKALTLGDNNHFTGLCVSLVYKNGERSMVASRGANDYLTQGELEGLLPEILASRVVYFSGYSLLSNSEVILYAMGQCRGRCEICFNPGAPNLIKDSFPKIIHEFVDTLILNIDEAKSIIGQDKIEGIASGLGNITPLSVITTGSEGCLVIKGKEWTEVPANNIVAGTDTTGAGDAFSAGFIVGRLRQMSEAECARLANNTAANFLKEKADLLP